MKDLDTNLKAVFAGIRNAIGVPALLLFSAMTGFGSLSQEQGLSLYISMLSHCQTLLPGDLICCGTSVGARTMKPGTKIDIVIPDIGTLSNPFDDLTD